MNPIRTFLSHVEPFCRLPGEELDRLSSIAQSITHAKGETIFNEGEDAAGVWILYKGRLEIFKYTSDGKPRAIEVIHPKDVYGTLCRIGGSITTYPCTAVASIDSVSFRIPDSTFQNLFSRYPAMVTGACTLCSQRLNFMQGMTATSQEPVGKRIVKTLLQLSEKYGNTLPFTKREIGEFAATTVETTIRTMSVLEKKNWISSSRGKVTLNDVRRLTSLVS